MTYRPPVFLDRDGTLIVERHYLSDPALVELEEGVLEGLSSLTHAGFPLIVLSNQSGIARGRLTSNQAQLVNARLAQLLDAHGIHIRGWYLCPHAPQDDCECRKPRPGMARAAAQDLGVELRGSFMVGDKRSDLELADAIGATGLLVDKGHAGESLDWARAHARLIFDNFGQAADYIRTNINGGTSKSVLA